MDLSFLLQLVDPIILGICLLAGYVLKTAIIIHLQTGINAEVVLGGMISGLAATGMYELLRNLLDFDGKKEK